MMLFKLSYKFHADVGFLPSFVVRHVALLDTRAGLNCTAESLLPQEARPHIRFGLLMEIADANYRPVDTVGTVSIRFWLGMTFGTVNVVVCKTLTAPLVLGCNYCDRFVDAIRPRHSWVDLVDGSVILFVGKPW